MKEDCTFIEHNMAPEQKLDMAEIRRIAPDSIEILRVKTDIDPDPQPDLFLVKDKTAIPYKSIEVEPSLYENELALLRQEFEVLEWKIWGTPLKQTVEAEKTEQ